MSLMSNSFVLYCDFVYHTWTCHSIVPWIYPFEYVFYVFSWMKNIDFLFMLCCIAISLRALDFLSSLSWMFVYMHQSMSLIRWLTWWPDMFHMFEGQQTQMYAYSYYDLLSPNEIMFNMIQYLFVHIKVWCMCNVKQVQTIFPFMSFWLESLHACMH